jgi:GDP-D-mannose 3',5'-epimerase
MKICVAGGAGFIGSHLARRLKKEGHHVVIADIQHNIYFEEKEICDEYLNLDLRDLKNCLRATEGCEWVFNLAADMGGMGFIQSNHAVILYNNTMISFNVMEAARRNNAKRFFYSSSACIYPEGKQLDTENPGLREEDAWPAQPQDAYGLEKLVSEEMAIHYSHDFGIEVRIARFHNIYGPHGTWKGGREKAPAAFLRKALVSPVDFEMWGDGLQTRSFCFVDDCVEGILRLMRSNFTKPLNLGSDEMVSMNQMAALALAASGRKDIPVRHIPGPEGVRGRNSNNDLIKKELGWAPSITLEEGLNRTVNWIRTQIDAEKATGFDVTQYASSKVVAIRNPSDVFNP